MLDGARVAVVNWRDLGHSLAGGSERYAWEFALALKEGGAVVDFLTAQDHGQLRTESVDGIRIRRRGRRFGFYPAVLGTLLASRFGRAYDLVVDAENGIPVFAPLVLARRTKVLLVMHHVHQEQFRTYFGKPLSEVGRFLERWLMPRVYRNVRTLAVSQSTHEEMIRQLDWGTPVEIVPNGASQPVAQTEVSADTSDKIVVLGRLATHKRIDLVITAVGMLRETRPDLSLDVIGRGPEADSLGRLIRERGLQEVVKLHGYLSDEDKAAVLGRSRLHVCASDAEGWGQVVIETAAFGLPTVARDVPGLRDSVQHGTTGWLVEDANEPSAVVDRLVRGIGAALDELDDAAQRSSYSDACRRWAGQFTWGRMHEQVRNIAEAELSQRDRPRRRRDYSSDEALSLDEEASA